MSTIYDIAKKAGVSPTTVSKVFNNYKDVSEKTKEKVLKIADEMGYIPNLSARSLKTNKSFLVGVVFSEDVGIGLEHQYFSVVLESFRNTIGTYGYDTVFINKSLGDRSIGYLEHCKYRNVDGAFIITASPYDMDFSKLMDSEVKCVTTDMQFENTPYVISDNAAGSRLATDYLYKCGHRKIAHLAGPLDVLASAQRYNSFVEHCMVLGLELNDHYLPVAEAFTSEAAYTATETFLKKLEVIDYPTAIFVSADIMALGVMRAIEDMGLKIPDDISVVGFDDIQLAEYTTPRLTTVKQDKKLIGKKVAETLYALMSDENVGSTITPVTLIERDSVKNIEKV